jgi:hypothetical protein
MKRALVMMLIGLMVFVMAGCGNNDPAPQPGGDETPAPSGGTLRLVIGSGPIGGAFYPLAGGMAAIVNENVDNVSVNVQVTAGGIENTRLIGSGEIDFGLTASDQAYHANNKSGMFSEENLELESMGAMHASVLQIAVAKSSGLTEFEDLVGKRVAIGEPGGGAEVGFKQLISSGGWEESEFDLIYLPYDQAMDQIADGLIDAAVVYAGLPAPSITSLAANRDVLLINVNDDLKEKLANDSPFWVVETIAAGTYTGMDEAINTPVQRILLNVRTGMDPDVVYEMTKAIYENLDQLRTYHASAASISVEVAHNTSIKLHEGAERYFREIGNIE